MSNIFKALLFGIIEGVTEWLPVSSTGHMILLNEFVKMDVSTDFWNMFLVVIQLGAIMAVVLLFWNKIFPFDLSKNAYKEHKIIRKDIWLLWFKILVACIPAIVIGLPLDDWIDEHLYNGYVVATMLIIFGILFIFVENRKSSHKCTINSVKEISFKVAFIIGMWQVIAAVLPGTSRSGATILGALLFGVSRKTAAEFTFFLAIPVMAGASLLKLLKFGFMFDCSEIIILTVGTVSAFLVSVAVIKLLMDYIKKHDFKIFGWYRIVLGMIVFSYFLFTKGL